VFDKSLFDEIKVAMDDKAARAAEDPLVQSDEMLRLEQDVIVPLAAARKMHVYETKDFWRQIKSAAYVAHFPR
jgi:mannose-1-phosphate guanylyltransferase